MKMNPIHNKRKPVVAKSFIRTLNNNKTYKYMNSKSKNVYIDKLRDKVNKYNNTYPRTIKMNPIDLNVSTYIDFNKENNEEDHKLEVVDHVKISNYKEIFAKYYTLYWSEEISMI